MTGMPRAFLYVPGDRPERLARAFSRGAEAIIADLEDAVADSSKDLALATVREWLDSLPADHAPVWVRVNTGERRDHEVRTLATSPHLAGLLLPKADTAGEVQEAHSLLEALGRPLPLAPMVESATALVNIHQIAAAPGVHQLHLGEMDLAADLGLAPGSDESELAFARSLTVVASRHAGLVPPAAPVSAEIDDREAFAATTRRLKRMGFHSRDCIHPAQVNIALEAFGPTAEETAWAAQVLDAAARHHGAYRDADGSMVDEAVLRRARGVLAAHTTAP